MGWHINGQIFMSLRHAAIPLNAMNGVWLCANSHNPIFNVACNQRNGCWQTGYTASQNSVVGWGWGHLYFIILIKLLSKHTQSTYFPQVWKNPFRHYFPSCFCFPPKKVCPETVFKIWEITLVVADLYTRVISKFNARSFPPSPQTMMHKVHWTWRHQVGQNLEVREGGQGEVLWPQA